MPPILQLDLQQVVSQSISFLVLLWVLRRFAWRPLLAVLDARRARIEQGLREIDEGKAQIARLQAEYGQRVAKINEEARAKIQQAVVEGKRIAAEIQEEARAQGHALITKSKDAIEMELAKAKVQLRDEVAAMTLEVVERVLRHKVDAETDQRLIEAVLDELQGRGARA